MMLFRGFYFYLKAVLGHLSESPRENVGDILKNVRENFENHGAFSLFGGVFWGKHGRKSAEISDEFGNFFKSRWEIAFFNALRSR